MELKRFYEKLTKSSISTRSWYRVASLMDQFELPLTRDNLKILVQLRKIAKSRKLPLSDILKLFTDNQIKSFKVDGKTLLKHIQRVLQTPPHRTTISRWFDGYEAERIYNSYEAKLIILHAFTYQLRNSKNGTQQRPNRSSAISSKKEKPKGF